jgi:hypothetical protein
MQEGGALMRKLTILSLTIFTVAAVVLLGLARSSASNQEQKPTLTKDGSKDPASIPDYIAYEFFFKSLISSPAEGKQGQERAISLAQRAGFDKSTAEFLALEATNIYQGIKAIEQSIKAIKDLNWPDPDDAVWQRLREKEREREASVLEQVNRLFAARRALNYEEKIKHHVKTEVKRKIKGFASQPNPGQHSRPHHGSTGMVLATVFGLLPLSAQMQGNETVYIYADTVYSPGNGYVTGYGDVTATASSYGHEYSLRTEMYGPCAGQFYSSENGFLAMPIDLCDGQYGFDCFAVQSCPIANTIRDAGSSGDSVFVAPFVTLNPFGNWDPDTISPSGVANISISLHASQDVPAGTSVSLSFGVTVSNGSAQLTATPADPPQENPFSFTVGPSGQRTITVKYDPGSVTGAPNVRAMCNMSVGGSIVAIGNPQTSMDVLRIR